MTLNEAGTGEQTTFETCQEFSRQFVSGPKLPRQAADVFVEALLRDALIRLNQGIAAQPVRDEEMTYKSQSHSTGCPKRRTASLEQVILPRNRL